MKEILKLEDVVSYDKQDFIKLINKIEKNADEHRLKIGDILNTVAPMVTNMTDFIIIAPIIKDYLKTSVDNDENLIKLASIAYKLIGENPSAINAPTSVEDFLTEEEKLQLYTLYTKQEDE